MTLVNLALLLICLEKDKIIHRVTLFLSLVASTYLGLRSHIGLGRSGTQKWLKIHIVNAMMAVEVAVQTQKGHNVTIESESAGQESKNKLFQFAWRLTIL